MFHNISLLSPHCRELSVVRSKFQEAEQHRDRMRAEMAELSSSSDEEKIKLSRCQTEKTLSDLIERRNALEETASVHAVSQMEVKAEITKLQDTVSGAQEAVEALEGEIEEKEHELRTLSGVLAGLEVTARECEERLNECEQKRIEEEEEETALRDEIDAKKESIRLQAGKLTATFKKYGQSALAEKYKDESRGKIRSEETNGSKVADLPGKVDERMRGLESAMKREKDSVEREVRTVLGDEQLACLEEDAEMFLRGARCCAHCSLLSSIHSTAHFSLSRHTIDIRETVVEKRERTSQLVLEAARVKALLSSKMHGLGEG
jgi:chromosome segregation ATPase